MKHRKIFKTAFVAFAFCPALASGNTWGPGVASPATPPKYLLESPRNQPVQDAGPSRYAPADLGQQLGRSMAPPAGGWMGPNAGVPVPAPPYGGAPYGAQPYGSAPYGSQPYMNYPYGGGYGGVPFGAAPYGAMPYGGGPFGYGGYGQPYGGGYGQPFGYGGYGNRIPSGQSPFFPSFPSGLW